MLEQPKNLVLAGGGAKGAIYLGVLKALRQFDKFDSIENIAGTSVGAIAALALASGLDDNYLERIVADTDFGELVANESKLTELKNFYEGCGIHNGQKLTQWLIDNIILKVAPNNPNITFREWHDLKQINPEKKLKDLFVVACNLNKDGVPQIFGHNVLATDQDKKHVFPNPMDVPIIDAIRASFAIPGFFEYKQIANYKFVDGGCENNFPVDVFSNDKANTLGVFLSSKSDINYINKDGEPQVKPLEDNKDIIKAELKALLNKDTFLEKHSDFKPNTIFCDTLGVGTLDFEKARILKERLIESGFNAVKDYFNAADLKLAGNSLGEYKSWLWGVYRQDPKQQDPDSRASSDSKRANLMSPK